MATIINTLTQTKDEESALGMAIWLILSLLVISSLFIYGLPFIGQSINQFQINLPERIN